jgi:hypothetical protein
LVPYWYVTHDFYEDFRMIIAHRLVRTNWYHLYHRPWEHDTPTHTTLSPCNTRIAGHEQIGLVVASLLTPLSAEGPRCPPWWSCASLGMARQGIRGHLLLRLPALAGLLAAVAGGFSKCAFDGEQQACLRFLGGDADHPPASATALGLSLETVRTECPVLLRRIVPACPSLVFGEAWLSACSPAEASPISLTATRLARSPHRRNSLPADCGWLPCLSPTRTCWTCSCGACTSLGRCQQPWCTSSPTSRQPCVWLGFDACSAFPGSLRPIPHSTSASCCSA